MKTLALTSSSFLMVLALIALAVFAAFGMPSSQPSDALAAELDGLFEPAQIVPEDLERIQTGTHATERHGEIAEMVRQAVKHCAPDKLKEMDGVNDYRGFKLFACLLETGQVAIWVVVVEEIESSPTFREITAFLSKSTRYLESLVENMRYVGAR